MSEGRKKYLIPIITSVVASVLLIAFCITAILSHREQDSDAKTLLYGTRYGDETDELLHMGVDIPTYRVKLDDEIEFVVHIGNTTSVHHTKPTEVYLRASASVSQGGVNLEIKKTGGEYKKSVSTVYENFDASEYSCRNCYTYTEESTDTTQDDDRGTPQKRTCEFSHSDSYTVRCVGEKKPSSFPYKSYLSFSLTGKSEEMSAGELKETSWAGFVTIYYVTDGEYIAFDSTPTKAIRKLQ